MRKPIFAAFLLALTVFCAPVFAAGDAYVVKVTPRGDCLLTLQKQLEGGRVDIGCILEKRREVGFRGEDETFLTALRDQEAQYTIEKVVNS